MKKSEAAEDGGLYRESDLSTTSTFSASAIFLMASVSAALIHADCRDA
jgi:hypothetical protein